jgi:hypothetical protein
MTSRRCTVLEQGASEQLGLNGYEVRIVPNGQDKRLPPAYLVAGKSGETRYIRIYKVSHRPATIDTVEQCFTRAILRYRTEMARHPDSPIRFEIWLYRVNHGYHCFAILPDRIQEIPPTGKLTIRILVEEVL